MVNGGILFSFAAGVVDHGDDVEALAEARLRHADVDYSSLHEGLPAAVVPRLRRLKERGESWFVLSLIIIKSRTHTVGEGALERVDGDEAAHVVLRFGPDGHRLGSFAAAKR